MPFVSITPALYWWFLSTTIEGYGGDGVSEPWMAGSFPAPHAVGSLWFVSTTNGLYTNYGASVPCTVPCTVGSLWFVSTTDRLYTNYGA